MKKSIISFSFAVLMVLSVAFVGDIVSSNNPFSVKAQTVKVKKKKVGAIRSAYRGGKYVGKQVWTGTRWVGVKTYQGAKYVGKKTWKGTKWVGRKVY
ncbi:MAG: hypothetical protein AAB336_12915 [Acidobacteriota bacterium]